MKTFSTLCQILQNTKSEEKRLLALNSFINSSTNNNTLWAFALLSNKRPKRIITVLQLRLLASEAAKIPDWLYEDCLVISGDQSEVNALLHPINEKESEQNLADFIRDLEELRDRSIEEKEEWIKSSWSLLENDARILFNKIITGTFRINVSNKILAKALSHIWNQEESNFLHRLESDWSPNETSFDQLFLTPHFKDSISTPYPFYYGYPLTKDFSELGEKNEWIAEYKWFGLRAQMIWRDGEYFLYSKDNELISDKFPELKLIAQDIKYDFVIDGEILPFLNGKILGPNHLTSRLKKQKASKKTISSNPVIFKAYDVLEYKADDCRSMSLELRNEMLKSLFQKSNKQYLSLSETVNFKSWKELQKQHDECRKQNASGIIIKRKSSFYKEGRQEGDWWKINADLLKVKAVLTYASRSVERRSSDFVDFTFGLWEEDVLITFTKVYDGLSDLEYEEIKQFVKKNTLERFGPVYSVKAELVFEIGFSSIQESKRHKSGILIGKPIILKWLKETPVKDANTLQEVKNLMLK